VESTESEVEEANKSPPLWRDEWFPKNKKTPTKAAKSKIPKAKMGWRGLKSFLGRLTVPVAADTKEELILRGFSRVTLAWAKWEWVISLLPKDQAVNKALSARGFKAEIYPSE
jgi:hypothetical protein